MSDLHALIRQALQRGWTVEKRRGGHLCWRPPGGGAQVFTGSTPSDHRNLRNIRSSLRRAGLILPRDAARDDSGPRRAP